MSSAELEANGSHWLRAVMHCHSCCSSGSCGMAQCKAVRGIIKHVHTSPPSLCSASGCHESACAPLRQLQAHFIECKDPSCALCSSVSQESLFPLLPDHGANTLNNAAGCYNETDGYPPRDPSLRSTVLYNGSTDRTDPTHPTDPRNANTRSPVLNAVMDDASCDGCSVSSSSGRGDEEDAPDMEGMDDTLATGQDHMEHVHGNGQSHMEHVHGEVQGGDWEALQASLEYRGGGPSGMPSSHLAAGLSGVCASVFAAHENEQLVVFGQFLLHSLLRWQGAPGYMMSPSAQAALLGAAQQECLRAGKALWLHLLRDCPRSTDACGHPGCMQARRVLLHMLECQDAGCSLCGPVKMPFAAGGPRALRATASARAMDMHSWMQDLEGSLTMLSL